MGIFININKNNQSVLNENGTTIIKKSKDKKERKFKCPYCNNKYTRTKLVSHIEKEHEELIPENYTAARIVFNMINHKEVGHCVNCGKETKWNEKTWRYERYCSEKCIQEYTRLAKERMKKKYGQEYILNDPEQQKKMLANRKISGEYKFQDGGIREYTGSYERKLLEFLDKVMEYSSEEVITPGPTVPYKYNNKNHFFITDLYLPSANLIFDVKDGGDNPNNRDMPIYRAKQIAKETAVEKQNKYNYIRLTNNNFQQLILILAEIKEKMMNDDNSKTINVNEFMAVGAINPPMGMESGAYIIPCMTNNGFYDAMYSRDRYGKEIYKVKDKKVKKIDRKTIKELNIPKYIFKYNGKDYLEKDKEIMESYKNQKDVPFNYFYETLSSHKLLSPNQLLFDENFTKELDGITELQETGKIIKESVIHQYKKAINKTEYFPIINSNLISLKESILHGYNNLDILQDINGYFVYNISTDNRSLSYKELNSIEPCVLELMTNI